MAPIPSPSRQFVLPGVVRCSRLLVSGLLVAALALQGAQAQDDPPDPQDPPAPDITIDPESGELVWAMDETDGYDIADFVKICEQITGRTFTFDLTELETNPKKISWIGVRRLKKEDFFGFFGTMLFIRGFALIPRGPAGEEMWEVVSLTGPKSRDIGTAARFVTTEEIPDYAGQTGVQILTTVDLEHTNAQTANNALRPFFAQGSAGGGPGGLQIGNVGDQRYMILMGFGPQVHAAYQLLKLVDQPVPEATIHVDVVPLEYAAAEEVHPHLEDLLNDVGGRPPQGQQGGGDPEASIQLKIVPLLSQNSIMLSGTEKQVLEAQDLIARLDLPQEGSTSGVHVVPLKNIIAEDLHDTLKEFLQADQTAERTSQQSATAGAAQVREQRPTVIQFHEETNSLLVSGTTTGYQTVLNLIEELDKKQPQVLIEAAVVELATNDIDRFGVELGLIDLKENGDFDRGFGFTSFGQSGFVDTDDDGFPNTRLPDFDNPLQGVTGGIISGDDFAIPLLINALAQDERANVLSLPSVLVNNNGEAEVSAFEERPTQENVQNANTATTSLGAPRRAGITLNISPSISSNNYLRLNIRLEVSRFTGAFDPNSVTGGGASVNRIISTQVTMPSNDTMVLGGVVEDRESYSDSGVPILKDIPILGMLFRTQSTENTKTNLYFFVTPKILDEEEFNDLREYSSRVKMDAQRYIGSERMQMVDRKWRGAAGVNPTLEDSSATTDDLDAKGNNEMPFYMRRNQNAKPYLQPENGPLKGDNGSGGVGGAGPGPDGPTDGNGTRGTRR